jgi:CheY-like chemotaxis protein
LDPIAPQTVLLVDDHEVNLAYLEALLGRPSVRFLRAGRGDEALEIARREHPCAILTDVCMPGMDGLEVCDAVRRDPELCTTCVILISAVIGRTELHQSADELGANGYFSKPFEPEAVRLSFERIMAGLAGAAA